MSELLFSCTCEKKALENVLAYNQIRKCDEGINKYKKEIEELRNEISKILKGQNISDNYMDTISKYKAQLKDMETSGVRKEELDKKIKVNDDKIDGFNAKIKELEDELESLKRVLFDSDDARVIFDTQKEIEVVSKRLEDLYTLVENISNDSTNAAIEMSHDNL